MVEQYPVSYTHLDVYKRQVYAKIGQKEIDFCYVENVTEAQTADGTPAPAPLSPVEKLEKQDAVSYTHLYFTFAVISSIRFVIFSMEYFSINLLVAASVFNFSLINFSLGRSD